MTRSCKLLDAATGQSCSSEIKILEEDRPRWRLEMDGPGKGDSLCRDWPEKEPLETKLSGAARKVPGWPWSGLGKGYASKYTWGFGRVLLAIDVATQKSTSGRISSQGTDRQSSGLPLAGGQLFHLQPRTNSWPVLMRQTGREVWKNIRSRKR